MTEFPNDEEITSVNYKTGWLRFKVGAFPVQAVDRHWQRLRKEVVLKLRVFDNKDNQHLIYEDSTVDLSGCGIIERRESAQGSVKEPITQFAGTKQEEATARKSRNEVLDDLIAFRDEGSRLLQKGREGFTPNLLDCSTQWEGKVGAYLATHIGTQDMEDFLCDEGMERFTTTEKPRVMGRFPASQDLLDRIHTRGRRLKKIIADLQAGRTL